MTMQLPVLSRFIGDLKSALGRGPDANVYPVLANVLPAAGSWLGELPLLVSPGGYSRTAVHAEDAFEIVLLNWTAGSASALHDHGGQHCWFGLLEGSLRVENYRRADSGSGAGHADVRALGCADLTPGDVDFRFESIDLHRVRNASGLRAVSIHIYAKPIGSFLAFDERAGTCSVARSSYDSWLSTGL